MNAVRGAAAQTLLLKQEPLGPEAGKQEPATAGDVEPATSSPAAAEVAPSSPAAAEVATSSPAAAEVAELLAELEGRVVAFLQVAPTPAAKPARKPATPKSLASPTHPGPSPSRLPPSILANKEPYRQGDWRREPYPARDYQPLTEYAISEPMCEPGIRRKLRTSKTGRCDGAHCTSFEGLGSYRWRACECFFWLAWGWQSRVPAREHG